MNAHSQYRSKCLIYSNEMANSKVDVVLAKYIDTFVFVLGYISSITDCLIECAARSSNKLFIENRFCKRFSEIIILLSFLEKFLFKFHVI